MPSDSAANLPPGLLLKRAVCDDLHFSAVVRLVAAYPPFRQYAFGLMVPRLLEQLDQGSAVLAVRGGQLVGYAGWLRVKDAHARRWQAEGGAVPPPHWADGDAAIVNVTVVREAALLPHLLRGVSQLCAGLPVYRLRSFDDGRPAMRRPPIHGRDQGLAIA